MIGVRLDGRLGNQMFQYAFALALSKKLNTSFYMSQFLWRNLLYKYFELPSNNKWINEKIERYFWKKLALIEEKDFYPHNWEEKCTRNNITYQGYFQSLLYFGNFERTVIKELTIKKKWKLEFEKKYSILFNTKKTIVIHLRKGDYQTPHDFGDKVIDDISVSNLYINKCLERIDILESYAICFISDDIPFCREKFSYLPNVQFEENNEIVDMQLLMWADVCIIGNSSFSWWGAYLNNKPHKKVYYPKYWRGYNFMKWQPYNQICSNLPWIAIHHKE